MVSSLPAPTMFLVPLALLGGCDAPRRAVSAQVVAPPGATSLTLTCRTSTSGRCHALVAAATATRGTAAVGETVRIGGVTPLARLCVSDRPVEQGRCQARPIEPGTQIIRHERSTD